MYSKIFVSMYDGSLATEGPWQALVTFQQMLILANRYGIVDMTAEAISRRTTIPLEVIEKGIPVLEAPDPTSRTDAEEGRRIMRLQPDRPWGWQIVNFETYNAIRTEEDRRDYMRKYMRERRKSLAVNSVNSVSLLDSDLAHTQTERHGQQADRFMEFWRAYPRKVKKKQASVKWKAKKLDAIADRILEDIAIRGKEDGRWLGGYIPDPTTYLTGERWNDEISEKRK